MPYIPQARRLELAKDGRMEKAGDLEYMIATAVTEYVATKGLSHQTIAEIRGVLIGAKDEFNRRVAFSYEDTKLAQNGDVYNFRQ